LIFCSKLFLTLVFVEDLFQACYFLLEEMMALVLKNSYNLTQWKSFVDWGFKGDALIWWKSFHHSEWMSLSKEALEKLLLDKWSHIKSKDKDITKSLFSCRKSILQVHGYIHKESVIVSINPSCKQNFINI
jgi:hypothetical protein